MNNLNFAGVKYVFRTTMYLIKMPYNALIKNMAVDAQQGNANFFWKYPLGMSAVSYPVPFYYHESKSFSD